MQHIIEVHAGTEAFETLKRMMLRAESDGTRVSLTYGSRGGVQLKCGGGRRGRWKMRGHCCH